MQKTYRIGQIVPARTPRWKPRSRPCCWRARRVRPERFTFHSSRMRMKKVVKEELAAMDAESDRCALELSDARVDVLGYACLVAIMAMGHGYHRVSQERLAQRTGDNGAAAPVVTSAGALIEALESDQGAKRIVVVAPYMKPLTELVVDYIRHEGFEVLDYRALEIPDNLEVGRHDPARLPGIVAQMDTSGRRRHRAVGLRADALAGRGRAESKPMTGKPVITAAIATTWCLLKELGLERVVPGAGALLSGAY